MKSLADSASLEDKLSRKDFHDIIDAKELFPNHLSYAEIHMKIREKKLHQGVFRASPENFLEGFVNVEAFDDPVSTNCDCNTI